MRSLPYNWPAFVTTVADWSREFRDERAARFVMRVLPPVLLSRARLRPDVFQTTNVLSIIAVHVAAGSTPFFMARWSDDATISAVKLAIKRRDAIAREAFVMPRIDRADGRIGDPDTIAEAVYDHLYDEQFRHVFDWIQDLDEQGLHRLGRLTWEQAVALMEAEERSRANDATNRIEALGGWHWRRLTSRRALQREGLALRNCLGSGSYDRFAHCPLAGGGMWSLRDPEGTPVVAAMLIPAGEGLLQLHSIYRAENEDPQVSDLHQFPALRAFHSEIGVRITPDLLTHTTRCRDIETVDGEEYVVHSRHIHDENGAFRIEEVGRMPRMTRSVEPRRLANCSPGMTENPIDAAWLRAQEFRGVEFVGAGGMVRLPAGMEVSFAAIPHDEGARIRVRDPAGGTHKVRRADGTVARMPNLIAVPAPAPDHPIRMTMRQIGVREYVQRLATSFGLTEEVIERDYETIVTREPRLSAVMTQAYRLMAYEAAERMRAMQQRMFAEFIAAWNGDAPEQAPEPAQALVPGMNRQQRRAQRAGHVRDDYRAIQRRQYFAISKQQGRPR